MTVLVQSFREFKSSQMANAAAAHDSLERYVVGVTPQKYTGPDELLETHRSLRYLNAGLSRLFRNSDFSSSVVNRRLDQYGSRHAADCSLFVGYSGSCLGTIETANEHDATTVVYRGAPHGSFFQTTLDSELREYGYEGVKRRTDRMTPREHREYRTADSVWTPSSFTAETLVENGIDREKISVLPYGVDVSQFSPDFDSDPTDETLLYVGHVSPEKGVHVLLDAFDRLDATGVELKLVGHVDDRLRDRIEAMDGVVATGWVDRSELTRLYQRASVFVFPSLADGYPSVVVEALACGCPVVTTDRVGNRDLVRKYDAGTVVTPNDAEAFSDAIRAVLADPELREQMAHNAVESIEAEGLDTAAREERMWEFMCEFET